MFRALFLCFTHFSGNCHCLKFDEFRDSTEVIHLLT